jgi:cellulose synthase (UDP-forming)
MGNAIRQWTAACAAAALLALACGSPPVPQPSSGQVERLDALSALWSFYKFRYVTNGRVVSLDEDHITTSEGQSYALLRAVWSDDRETFAAVWRWTQENLQVRGDHLFAWKWKERVLDRHAATDADVDIALALVLAARRFSEPRYLERAQEILGDIWEQEIVALPGACIPTAGDWTLGERFPVVHVGYLAPHAYAEFAKVDPDHDWDCVARTSYRILHWLYFEQGVQLPPVRVWVDRDAGWLRLEDPRTGRRDEFNYDVFPLFWRVAIDASWQWRFESSLRARMLAPLQAAFEESGRIYDRYTTAAEPLSRLEGLPLYATAHALAEVVDPALALRLREEKLEGLWALALAGKDTPYYLHNWLWFDEALSLQVARRYDEFLGFLRPFDLRSFAAHFPTVPFAACLALFPLARLARGSRWERVAVWLFLAAALAVCLRYLAWRGLHSLNFVEPLGPLISISLWIAELYCFVSVVLLLVQTGTRAAAPRERPDGAGFDPSVDVLIPVYREPLEILERTLTAAAAMRYPRASLHVLDDGHRNEVRALAERRGARYHRGPRSHAKAGNLNQALARTRGELVAVFDTDHVPVASFLEATVPWFRDPGVGFVQTPHHFRNPDVFQRAFRMAGRIPNEQDMFNHGMQEARDGWGGAFFVGSGAVFRRAALDSVGGFKLLSITEDIHTSQHVHAAGWRSVYVNRDLAAGLSAESLASYLVQRRRWMLGCLQVFFRDNPLLCRGLSARQRFGYFASLYHFFFPAARVIFWLTPLWYLFFHLHPILSEVSVLTSLLLPYLVVLPLMSAVLLPGWSRPLWGAFYENAVSAPLARSMFDLLLPRSLGFKVTPKGIVTQTRRFDWHSSRATLVLAVLTALGIAKGLWEFHHFGIERDAYFFNLVWAGYNLLFLTGALMVAWERPQRREEDRALLALPARVHLGGSVLAAKTRDLGLGGCSLEVDGAIRLPDELELELPLGGGLRVRGSLVYHERIGGRDRAAVRFRGLSPEARDALLLGVFANAETWKDAHAREARNHLRAAGLFGVALAGWLLPLRKRRRHQPRRRRLSPLRAQGPGTERRVLLRDASTRGLGLLCLGPEPAVDEQWHLPDVEGAAWGRTVWVKRRLGGLWSVGVERLDAPRDGRPSEVQRAA